MNTKEIFHFMWERIFSKFGILETIISDKDEIFRSDEWQRLTKEIRSLIFSLLLIINRRMANRKVKYMKSKHVCEITRTTIKQMDRIVNSYTTP